MACGHAKTAAGPRASGEGRNARRAAPLRPADVDVEPVEEGIVPVVEWCARA